VPERSLPPGDSKRKVAVGIPADLPVVGGSALGYDGVVQPSVYLETTIVSYLAGPPSRDLVTAARQQLTTEWWTTERARFSLHVSELVLQEAAVGDAEAAKRRLAWLDGISVLRLTDRAATLARVLLEQQAVPRSATADALHIGLAAAHGIDYLLTWNCRHIANAAMRQRIESVCRACGFEPPVLCTPDELMEA
jgi:predicted nucleic acid-binding protein